MAAVIGLSCHAPAAVGEQDRAMICAEVLGALRAAYPDHRFENGDTPPAIALTLTHATPRGMGMEVSWTMADGHTTPGKPLSTAFYDRPSDPVTRGRFYKAFLTRNPLPF